MSIRDDTPRIRVEPKDEGEPRAVPQPHGRSDTVELAPQAPSAAPFRFESLFDQYEILDKIGDGGMGVVYLARDRKLGRHVAVKRLNASALNRNDLKDRFLHEARAIAALNHIHIVHVYALGEDDDGPYIIMEYVPGPPGRDPARQPPAPYSLADKIHIEEPLSPADALDLIIKVCRAIEYAHGCGVIHRDLKPTNVLLDVSGEPKIVDFGLARRLSPDDERLTVSGEKMLSLGYGAPEQEADASLADERADVYGLGAVLYFSLTGQNPRYFREADLPETLRAPIIKALKTDREKRWSSVREFAEALQSIQTPSTVVIPSGKTTWRCKWCDTINPVAIPYCGECGWDGREWCVECADETRVGVPFCGRCGADARQYEAARRLRERLHQNLERRAYDIMVQQSTQLSGFQPIGPNGRRLLKELHDLRGEAERALNRRDELQASISREFSAGNYERARRLIQEYDTLATDHAFSDTMDRIPDLIRDRDLQRIRDLINRRSWKDAERLSLGLQDLVGPGAPEAHALLQAIHRHRWEMRLTQTAVWVVLVILLYLGTAPALYRLTTGYAPAFGRSVNVPFDWARTQTALRTPLRHWIRLVGAEDLYYAPPAPAPAAASLLNAPEGPPAEATELVQLLTIYDEDMTLIDARHHERVEAWPRDYVHALVALMHSLQRAGDFEGWEAARWEWQRFESDPTLPDRPPAALPETLRSFQDEQRILRGQIDLDHRDEVIERTRVAIADLSALQMAYTKAGKMDIASAVNTEMKRLRGRIDALTASRVTLPLFIQEAPQGASDQAR